MSDTNSFPGLFKQDFSKTREKTIEQYLINKVKKLGGIAYKFTSPNRRSVPDRLCVLPSGVIMFVECKAPGKKPTAAQANEHERLKALGAKVFCCSTKQEVDEVLNRYATAT